MHHLIRVSEKTDKTLDGRLYRNHCYSVGPPTTQSIGEYVDLLISAHVYEAYLLRTQKGLMLHMEFSFVDPVSKSIQAFDCGSYV